MDDEDGKDDVNVNGDVSGSSSSSRVSDVASAAYCGAATCDSRSIKVEGISRGQKGGWGKLWQGAKGVNTLVNYTVQRNCGWAWVGLG